MKILKTKLIDQADSGKIEKEKMEKVLAAEKREIEAKLETIKSVSEARIRELETQIKYLSSK